MCMHLDPVRWASLHTQMDLVNALLDDNDDSDGDGGGGGGDTRGRRGETETEAEGEAREAAQCLAMAEAVLSEEGSADLAARLRCSGHWGLLPQRGAGGRKKSAAEAAGNGGGASEEPEEDDEAAAAEDEAGPGDGDEDACPVGAGAGAGAGAEESGPERHRRLARDTAGTVLLWLLCLQVRACMWWCGAYDPPRLMIYPCLCPLISASMSQHRAAAAAT